MVVENLVVECPGCAHGSSSAWHVWGTGNRQAMGSLDRQRSGGAAGERPEDTRKEACRQALVGLQHNHLLLRASELGFHGLHIPIFRPFGKSSAGASLSAVAEYFQRPACRVREYLTLDRRIRLSVG